MATNEQKGLDAVIRPCELTLGKLARLERIGSPLLSADFSNLTENLKSLYAVSVGADEFFSSLPELEKKAVEWGDGISMDEYESRLAKLCEGLVQFQVLMPRPDEDAKKKAGSATDGSSSSPSGVAEHTATS